MAHRLRDFSTSWQGRHGRVHDPKGMCQRLLIIAEQKAKGEGPEPRTSYKFQ